MTPSTWCQGGGQNCTLVEFVPVPDFVKPLPCVTRSAVFFAPGQVQTGRTGWRGVGEGGT